MKNWSHFLAVMVRYWCISMMLWCCTPKQAPKLMVYEGPLQETENIVVHYTEREKVKTVLQAKKLNQFQNGDKEFPEGIYVEFYDQTGKITSTLRANTAYYFKQDNKWRGRGKVVVINLEKSQQLNSEELFWLPATKKIYTDKFVTITDKQDVIYGTGLQADQDLSNYTIKNLNNSVVAVEDN